MYKDLYSNNSPNKSKVNINTFRITKQNLNDINDYILNFQRYYELIKNNPNLRPKKKPNELDLNTINIDNLNKKLPYNTLQNDINKIYRRVYTDNSIEKNNINNQRYNSFINQKKFYLNDNIINIENKRPKNKLVKNQFNSTEKLFNEAVEDAIKINIDNKNNVKRDKFEYGNYAMNNTNFNHPQLYLLKYNKSYDMKNKLPQINYQNGFKITRTGDLSNLIPQNNRKNKFRNNFYNYYIGMKHSKKIFNA